MVNLKRRIIDVVVGLSSDEDRFVSQLRTLARIGTHVAPTWQHRKQLRMLSDAIEQDHSAVELVRRLIRECHPNYRRSLANLIISHGWEGAARRERFRREHEIAPPSFIVISPLAACNLRCEGCYAGAYGDTEPVLSYQDMTGLIDEVREYGGRFITISGGEPTLLWKRIPGEERGLRDLFADYPDTMFLMYTNGTLIDDAMAAEMTELGNVTPAISIEGHEEQTDARRGVGTFDRILAAMAALRRNDALFGASVTYTSRNFDTVASDEFVETLIDLGCAYAWYFMYVPVGREPDLSLVVSPQQRQIVACKTWEWLVSRPILVADFWNSGALTKGCIAAGNQPGYLHVTHRGDICPCVFMMYSKHNIHEMDTDAPLLEALQSDFFEAIREGQEGQDNPLAPCQIVDHPETLRNAVESCGARSTQEGQQILDGLAAEVAARAEIWRDLARGRWTTSGTFRNFADQYEDGDWLKPG